MCGIVGYIGKENNPLIGLEALKRLEYRGYDSSGMALYDSLKKKIVLIRAVGKVKNLEEKIPQGVTGNPFIFHTRWSTHGAPSEKNAHPHYDCHDNIFVVHNGIIENYKALKTKLIAEKHHFNSDTDTEVVAHLIEKFFKGNLEDAIKKALRYIKGSYGLAVISKNDPDKIVLARFGSPLLIGIGDNEYIAASDSAAIISRTKKVIYLEDNEIAVLTPSKYSIYGLDHQLKNKEVETIEWSIEKAQKGGYSHFMLKEIMEQADCLTNSQRGRMILKDGLAKLGGLEVVKDKLRDINRIKIVACGTAYHAGLIGKYMLEEYAGIPTDVDLSSEFRYRKQILDKKTALLAISQSGETYDTLSAIKEAKEKELLTLGIVNVVGSSIARETDSGVYNHAGPEIGVASTKAFTSQLEVMALLTIFLGRQREMSMVTGQRIIKEISRLPILVKKILLKKDEIRRIAKKYKDIKEIMLIGRKYNFPVALEGALKIKEISYTSSHGYPAGEMKHGPIALVDQSRLTIALCPQDSVYEKMISNIEEIRARGGFVLAVATEGDKKIAKIVQDVIYIPKTLEMLTPILSVIPLQLFAYFLGTQKGYDVDKPRNLAKSVTVE